MKKILVPIDFRDCSTNAVLFAQGIAEQFSASLTILHVDDGTVSFSQDLAAEGADSRTALIRERMKTHFDTSTSGVLVLSEQKVDFEVIKGNNPTKLITALSADYDLVVMGMANQYLIDKQMFGNIASGVAQRGQCPVLLVPELANYAPFQHMVYACNWESMQAQFLQESARWAGSFRARIDFVHVNASYEIRDFTDDDREIIVNTMNVIAPETTFNIIDIKRESPLREIRSYAHREDADLIIVANRQRSFLSNLLAKSLTKELALFTRKPMLVFQIHQEE